MVRINSKALFSGFSEYVTGNSDIFVGLDNLVFNRNQDYKFQLSGPILKIKSLFFNVRDQVNRTI